MNLVPCKGCRKPIFWATSTKSGKRIPIDFDLASIPETAKVKGHLYHVLGLNAEPIRNAEQVLGLFRDGRSVVDVMCEVEGTDTIRTYQLSTLSLIGVSHYLTCPDANKFGKGKQTQ